MPELSEKSDSIKEYSNEDMDSSSSHNETPIAFHGNGRTPDVTSVDQALDDSDDTISCNNANEKNGDDDYQGYLKNFESKHKRSRSGQTRRESNNSFNKSLEIIRRSLTGNSVYSNASHFSVKEIYGDLSSEQIEKERARTKKDVLNELQQNLDLENNIEPFKLPESGIPIENNGEEFGLIDPELITWENYDDPEDPRNWPLKRKVFLLGFVSIYALVSPMSSSMLTPAISEISTEFNITNPTISSMLASIQILAWAVGPLLIAPLSEFDYIGRKPILDLSIWFSFFFNLACALSKNTAQMLIFRFICGLFGSSPLNVGAGVISDLFAAKSRNMALAGFTLAPLLGPVIAPVIAGFIVQNLQWRWVFYVLTIFNGAVAVSGLFFFRETYSPKLLKNKAKRLRASTGNHNLHTIYEMTNQSFSKRMWLTMTRPVKLLFTHPMVIGLGSFLAFVYGFMYLLIVTFPDVFYKNYGFDKGTVGLMYIPMGVGFTIGIVFWTWIVGSTYNRLTDRNNGVAKPEFRLPCLFVVGIIIPIGLIWYGWSAQRKLHWIMPGIGSGIFAFGFICAFQCCQSYLIDMNPRFAASSVAAAALFRSLFGFSFPLFANKMYDTLNYGWGNTMCAFIALLLGVPFPLYCYFNGEKIRNRFNEKFDSDQLQQDKNALKELK